MSEREKWKVAPWTRHDKEIHIYGPGTLHLTLDHDDVDLDEVEGRLPFIVEALNREPPFPGLAAPPDAQGGAPEAPMVTCDLLRRPHGLNVHPCSSPLRVPAGVLKGLAEPFILAAPLRPPEPTEWRPCVIRFCTQPEGHAGQHTLSPPRPPEPQPAPPPVTPGGMDERRATCAQYVHRPQSRGVLGGWWCLRCDAMDYGSGWEFPVPAPPPPVTDAACPAAGSETVPGKCFKCGAVVTPSPCHCGAMHTGTYCWPCHHKNVRNCAAPHCPKHGAGAWEKWLEEHDAAWRSRGQGGESHEG